MMQLNNVYQRDGFIRFLEEDLLTDFKKDIRPVNTSSLTCIKKAQYLGESKDLDLQVFEFIFEGSANKRVTLTKDAFSVMRSSAIYNALAVFHTEDSKDWRFSLLTATPEPTEKGKVSLTYSNPKRLSFFLGPNAKVNTPTKFLISKGKIVDFDDLKSRFSIEVVNKEFYKEISQAFTELVSGQLKLPSTQDKSQTNLEFAVRLIGRIIFCWFLREKKSDAGLSLMPKELLSIEAVQKNKDYYHSILEPIFFEVLNKQVKSRRDDFAKEPFSSVPYLNGGLFSPQEDDFYKRLNGDFQSQFHNTLVIPDKWLNNFFEILETYNFTIDENTSYDEELSIDPEMLGRIFENLLAEINPETGESARKSTGSYYTPRTIVNYMVDESLLLYLKEQTGIKEEKLRAIISYDLSDDSENPVNTDEKEKIIEALEKVKILDPACGSGAFPIGALQKIVFILQQTDPDGQLWFKKQIKNTSPEVKRVIEREFEHKNFDYIRKLGIIRENIYGVDIQAIATEISRLRCFLTLIVDERIRDEVENRGIEPLPNLDFKFVTANSLIGLPKIDQSQQSMFDDYQKIDDLKNIRDQYFNASGIEREQLKTEFVTQQKRLVDQLIKEHGFMGVAKAELTQKLTDWEPFTHKPTSWFDREWMFGIKGGFDIIIANPPYISHDKIEIKEYLKKTYTSYEAFADLYCYFIEHAIKSQNNKGILCFITSNSYLRADYGRHLRKIIRKLNLIKELINIDDYQLFGSAIVNTSIIISQSKSGESVNESKATIVNSSFTNVNSFNDFLHQNSFYYLQSDFDTDSWTLITPEKLHLQKKIEKSGTSLEKLGTKIRLGIATGNNDVFIIDEVKKQQLIDADNNNSELIKPILRGKDIFRYHFKHSGLYIILAKNGVNVKSDYPSIYSYFDSFGEKFKKRGAQGQKWWNLRACAFFDDFKKEKIVWIELNDDGRFALAKDEIYLVNSAYFLLPPNGYPSRFLLGILNSKVIRFYLSTIAETSGMGVYRWINNYVKKFPIPNVSEHIKDKFIQYVDKVISLRNSSDLPTGNLQKEIEKYEGLVDQMVYQLYGLTAEEISIVEGS